MRELTKQQRFESAVDPVRYCEHFLGENITVEAAMDPAIPIHHANAPIRQQRQIMRAVAQHPMVSVAGSNMFGKSHMLTRLASWWLDRYTQALVVVTAPSIQQTFRNFVVPFRRLRGTVEVPTGKSNSKVYMPDPDFFERQIMCTTAQDPENFAGWHHFRNRLFIIDEASAVHKDIWDAIRAMVGREDSQVIAVGNPLREEDEERFIRFKQTAESPAWRFFSLNAWLHPNVVAGRSVIPGSMSPTWPEEMRLEWGEDSPQYIARVLGRFSTALTESMFALYLNDVIPKTGFNACKGYGRVLGVDPAGAQSGDKTSICQWDWNAEGQTGEIVYVNETATPEQMATKVKELFKSEDNPDGADAVGVDTNGLGYMLPNLLEKEGIPKDRIFRYVGHTRPNDRRYDTKYTEDAFELRAFMQDSMQAPSGHNHFQLKYNQSLHLQLSSRKFVTRNQKFVLRDKYSALKSSPDEFDSLLIAADAAKRFRKMMSTIPPQTPQQGFVPTPPGSFTPIDQVMPYAL